MLLEKHWEKRKKLCSYQIQDPDDTTSLEDKSNGWQDHILDMNLSSFLVQFRGQLHLGIVGQGFQLFGELRDDRDDEQSVHQNQDEVSVLNLSYKSNEE